MNRTLKKSMFFCNVDTVEQLEKNIDVLLKNIKKWIKSQATDINIRMQFILKRIIILRSR